MKNLKNGQDKINGDPRLTHPNLPDPLRPRPIEPLPSPLRPGQYVGPQDQLGKILKEILDKLTLIETRLKNIEETLKTRGSVPKTDGCKELLMKKIRRQLSVAIKEETSTLITSGPAACG